MGLGIIAPRECGHPVPGVATMTPERTGEPIRALELGMAFGREAGADFTGVGRYRDRPRAHTLTLIKAARWLDQHPARARFRDWD